MLKRFIIWLICFGLSFLVANLGWADRGVAFSYIYMLTILSLVIIQYFKWRSYGYALFDCLVVWIVYFGLIIGSSFAISMVLNVNYGVTFQIITLGSCINFEKA